MSGANALRSSWPVLGEKLSLLPLADLPTPVRAANLEDRSGSQRVLIKEDNLSGRPYGGNKVRKLEYALAPARARHCHAVATFGTVGSHHALATALYARQLGFDCICFLSHQARTGSVPMTLNMLLASGTELVRFGGSYAQRIATLRRHLHGRKVWVVPAGGSSWRGTVGFVNAGLELAAQIGRQECPVPERLYVAAGTMGTAAGLALGLALAGVTAEVHAVRVSHTAIANERRLGQLCARTAHMMRRLDPAIPADLAQRVRLRLRHEFFAGGYARSDRATEQAIATARRQLNLTLEPTYTGKAMAALLHDCRQQAGCRGKALFWQSYHAAPLPVHAAGPLDAARLPAEFLRYFS
ncbi:MAG TPA: pyridoxal-phosphate dependent enzyme [Woeseiaceae bacterium]|nr:pyridoxal-phosphate dependent enzyme [Woeseiaceae bacterium]